MGDSLTTVLVFFLAAILLFLYPMMTLADRADDVSQIAIQTATASFVDNVRETGKLTEQNYSAYIGKLGATGNTFRIELKIQRLDINPSKKAAYENSDTTGKSTYYNLYTYQIENALSKDSEGNNGVIYLKKGDVFSTSVVNTSETLSASMKKFMYKVTGNSLYNLSADYSGIILTNGQ